MIANNTGAGQAGPGIADRGAERRDQRDPVQPGARARTREFVELANPSATESVDLSGWTIDGIGLTIQPGTVHPPERAAWCS